MIHVPPIIPPTRHFAQKINTKICAKKSPLFPCRGELGSGLGPIDCAQNCRYHSGQAEAQRPPPSEPPESHKANGDRKGEVNMTTPNTGELLVQQAQEAERLRLLLLANECKDLDEFRQRLRDLLNK